jgi:hypothetical protein
MGREPAVNVSKSARIRRTPAGVESTYGQVCIGTSEPNRSRAMTEAKIETELQTLKAQLAALQEEHAKTRHGWRYWLRITGFLLTAYSIAVFAGVLMSHAAVSSNPIAVSLTLTSLFMLAFGLWLLAWSNRWMAERLMKVAPRQ